MTPDSRPALPRLSESPFPEAGRATLEELAGAMLRRVPAPRSPPPGRHPAFARRRGARTADVGAAGALVRWRWAAGGLAAILAVNLAAFIGAEFWQRRSAGQPRALASADVARPGVLPRPTQLEVAPGAVHPVPLPALPPQTDSDTSFQPATRSSPKAGPAALLQAARAGVGAGVRHRHAAAGPPLVHTGPKSAASAAAAPAPANGPAGRSAVDGLAVESDLLSEAVRALRVERDPAGALALLVVYRQRYPVGALMADADLVAIDANLQVGRSAAALEILDRLQPAAQDRLPRHAELAIAHAELLVEAQRFSEARKVFEQLEATDLAPDLSDRAQVGLATCLGRLGEPARARAKWTKYLADRPDGRFAARARAELGVAAPE